jgi:putative PIN family toxin of toxin-antitoxin system
VRLVLDTNVLLAAVLADGLCRDLVRKRIKPHDLFVSQALLDELAGQLREKFGQDAGEVPLLAAYQDRAALISAPPLPDPVCRDPDDDVVLSTAIAARADLIITGDQDLLVLGQYGGIRILSPRQFLEWLDRQP